MGAAQDGHPQAAAPGGGPAPDGAPGAPGAPQAGHPPCCPLYHEAIELIGRRWTGAIVSVLIHRTTLRFGEIADSVPELSDRLLSERMKELEARGVVIRTVHNGRPVRVEYEQWARRWLAQR
jgi:DNA-binding HxlR family transcriptional regulator